MLGIAGLETHIEATVSAAGSRASRCCCTEEKKGVMPGVSQPI